MELALNRIELNQDINPDSINWELFKDVYLEKEKLQILQLITFMRTSDKMGKSTEDLYNEFINK